MFQEARVSMSKQKQNITKAIFPVAGLGTRFLPVTKSSPKEMLPIVNKPLIQYAVEEAYDAGIREMIFVTRQNKNSIEDHFDRALELEINLKNGGKSKLISIVNEVKPHDMECIYIRQPEPLGLGHAVLTARNLIENEYFALLLADDLMVNNKPVLRQMMDQYYKLNGSIIAIEKVSRDMIKNYGIVEGTFNQKNVMTVKRLIEKPSLDQTQSDFAIVGRYILSSKIFELIQCIPHNERTEIQITDAIQRLLAVEPVYGYAFEGHRFDCGSKLGFLKANIMLGVQDPDCGEEYYQWLKDFISNHKS